MRIEPLPIDGSWRITTDVHPDPRGTFTEWYRFDHLAAAVGHPLDLAQANVSVSRRGVVRGVHFAAAPGQAKYVMCARGAVLDVAVDLRVGSPTFRQWSATRLDDVSRTAVFLTEGLGHAFCALTDEATVVYLCSAVYNAAAERVIDPFDPDLAIGWPQAAQEASDRDARAPGFGQMLADRQLPSYRAYLDERAGRQAGCAAAHPRRT